MKLVLGLKSYEGIPKMVSVELPRCHGSHVYTYS